VTPGGSLGEKEWPVNLCSAYSTEKIHLWTVWYMFDNSMQIMWSPRSRTEM